MKKLNRFLRQIGDLMEDYKKFSKEVLKKVKEYRLTPEEKRKIKRALEDIKAGRVYTLEEIRKIHARKNQLGQTIRV